MIVIDEVIYGLESDMIGIIEYKLRQIFKIEISLIRLCNLAYHSLQ